MSAGRFSKVTVAFGATVSTPSTVKPDEPYLATKSRTVTSPSTVPSPLTLPTNWFPVVRSVAPWPSRTDASFTLLFWLYPHLPRKYASTWIISSSVSRRL